jgi:hypothetical protein
MIQETESIFSVIAATAFRQGVCGEEKSLILIHEMNESESSSVFHVVFVTKIAWQHPIKRVILLRGV